MNVVAMPKRRNAQPEAGLQAAILELVRLRHPQALIFSIPNGGFVLEPRIVAKLKWQGLVPGVPDLCVIWPDGHGWLEVKSEGGRLSAVQSTIQSMMRAMGQRVAVVRSVLDVMETFATWGVPEGRG